MRQRSAIFALLLSALATVSCRAMQIQKLEERIDQLEARQAASEARIEALQRK